MSYHQKIKEAIAALMISFTIMVTIFQVVDNFLTPLYSSLIMVAALITSIILLFINEDNRRNMRIASICTNSIAIGSIIGTLFNMLDLELYLLDSIVLSAIFLGITFFIYYLFSHFESRVVPGFLGAGIVISIILGSFLVIFPNTEDSVNLYIFMNLALLIIHYITALIVVKSSSKSIIDGMAYGYFGMTLVILVVAGIVLLIASDGDLDVGDMIPSGSGSDSKSAEKITRAIENAPTIDIYPTSTTASTRDPNANQKIMQSAYYAKVLGAMALSLTAAEIGYLNSLEERYNAGEITKQEYDKRIKQCKKW